MIAVCNTSHLFFRSSSIFRYKYLLYNRIIRKMSNQPLLDGPFVASIDQGTSSTRVILYDANGTNLLYHQVPLPLINPKPGWVEQDPSVIMETVKTCLIEVANKAKISGFQVSPKSIKAVGITNQRETTVVWDKTNGKALYNTIVWSDARTNKLVAKLAKKYEAQGGLDSFRLSTGLPISTYFSALKLKWMMKHVPEVKQAIIDKRALFGTNLTGASNGGVHVTDVTNASRTLLMNLKSLNWDENIVTKEFEIPMEMLPVIKSSSEVYGKMQGLSKEIDEVYGGVPLAGCLGDQQAALVGQRCLSKGLAKSTYGTGCFVLYNTGTDIVHSDHGLLTTVAYQLGPDANPYYALEGSISAAGSGIDWLKQCLELKESTKELMEIASTVPNSAGVCFVPTFNGMFAPRWKPDARGTILGLTFFTKKAHVVRSLVESIAFQATDVLTSMEKDSKSRISNLRADGGLANSDLLLQLQADSLNSIVDRPNDIESTARGAAFAAGLAVGLYPTDSANHPILEQTSQSFKPLIDEKTRAKDRIRWEQAVERALDWAQVVDDQVDGEENGL